jgi:hypothetical protein
MLVEPVKDLLDAFVIGVVNRLVTVATVENQHFEPGVPVPERAPELGAVID